MPGGKFYKVIIRIDYHFEIRRKITMAQALLTSLRESMRVKGYQALYVPTADPHQSEFVGAHYSTRAMLTGFTGSAGTAVVTADDALLWTDGRYFLQAGRQIKNTGFSLMKLATKGYPSPVTWLKQNLKEGDTLAFNGLLISASDFDDLEKALSDRKINLVSDESILEDLWVDRPDLPEEKVFIHEQCFAGASVAEKLAALRRDMAKEHYDACLISSLDNLAWLMNFRGRDIPHNPVAYTYALVTGETAFLYIDKKKTERDFVLALEEAGIAVRPYEAIREDIGTLKGRVQLDKKKTSQKLRALLPAGAVEVDAIDPVSFAKAVLNDVEEKNQREAWIRDSLAVTRYLFWLKKAVQKDSLDEYTAAKQLQRFRAAGKHYLEDSFEAISAYGKNGPLMHYLAEKETAARLSPRGLYLIDSGGQYLDGTTDMTRTIALGPLSPEQIRDYTLVLKAHVSLASAIFLEGSSGHYLDVLARQPLWKHHIDYKSGTGHAIGYVLGVHEGPQRISPVVNKVALKENMMVSIEPGIYRTDHYGIRLENVYLVKFDAESEGDRYFRFDVISYVPFDRDAIDISLLNDEERDWINRYHAVTERLLMPLLNEDERQDLRLATAPL
jgi:Xaa-Pro aminopeptidase